MYLASASRVVQDTLQSWVGYETLAEVLTECPCVDVFLAGGAIRNALLDPPIPAHDFDFFLDGPSITRAFLILERHGELKQTPYGSPRWHPSTDPEQYADLIPIRDFKPGLWRCEDIVDVLNQFDYTASALAFDLRSWRAFDPQNGLRDLRHRTMRMVRFDYPEGPFIPGAVLSRNAILWFRILHYAKLLGFVVEPLTLEWLRAHRDYERQVAPFTTLFFQPHDGYLDLL